MYCIYIYIHKIAFFYLKKLLMFSTCAKTKFYRKTLRNIFKPKNVSVSFQRLTFLPKIKLYCLEVKQNIIYC